MTIKTLAAAKTELRTARMTITKRDGEYRVAFDASWNMSQADQEATSCYTDDLTDAVSTGQHMSRTMTLKVSPPALALTRNELCLLEALTNAEIRTARRQLQAVVNAPESCTAKALAVHLAELQVLTAKLADELDGNRRTADFLPLPTASAAL